MIKNLRTPFFKFLSLVFFGLLHLSVHAQYCGNLDRKSSAYFQCEQLRLLKQQESRQLNERINNSVNENRTQEPQQIDRNKLFQQEADLLIKQFRLKLLEVEIKKLIQLHEQTKSDYCSNFNAIEKEWIRTYSKATSTDNTPPLFSDVDNFMSLYSEALQISCRSDKTKLLEFLVHTLNSRDFNRSINSAVLLGEFTSFNSSNYIANKFLNELLGSSKKPVEIADILLKTSFNESFLAIKFIHKQVGAEIEASSSELEKIKQLKK